MEQLRQTLVEAQEILELDPEIRGAIINSSTEDKKSWTYVTPKFLLQVFDDEHATVSFTINSYKIQQVAYLMHTLTLFFYDTIKVIEDNFVDTKNEEIYYGSEAYTRFQEHVHTKNGYTRCPICEKLASKEFWLPEKGYCKVCELEVIPTMSFH
jgi:hypothetical protein